MISHSPNIVVRPATTGDLSILADYNQALAGETENRQLDRELLVPGIAALLADPSKGYYFVAESNGAVVGQIMITFEWSDWRNGVFWWIQSVYVAPKSRRAGVFRSLYSHVETLAKRRADVCGLRLYMEHANHAARSTYLSLGMAAAGYEVLEVDFRAPSHSKS
jgi:GNAT superfamily N-acetyltransferase